MIKLGRAGLARNRVVAILRTASLIENARVNGALDHHQGNGDQSNENEYAQNFEKQRGFACIAP